MQVGYHPMNPGREQCCRSDLYMQFLAPNALNFVQTSLGATYSESLGPAATASVIYLETFGLHDDYHTVG